MTHANSIPLVRHPLDPRDRVFPRAVSLQSAYRRSDLDQLLSVPAPAMESPPFESQALAQKNCPEEIPSASLFVYYQEQATWKGHVRERTAGVAIRDGIKAVATQSLLLELERGVVTFRILCAASSSATIRAQVQSVDLRKRHAKSYPAQAGHWRAAAASFCGLTLYGQLRVGCLTRIVLVLLAGGKCGRWPCLACGWSGTRIASWPMLAACIFSPP